MKEKKKLLLLILILLLVASLGYYVFRNADLQTVQDSSVRDADGNEYKTVQIGEQVWLAENLYVSSHPEGESWCYLDEQENCEKYGRLYDGAAAMVACPDGWSLPSSEDWEELLAYINDEERIGAHLKAKDSWETDLEEDFEAFDTYGFTALPGGHYFDGYFYTINTDGYWWSSTAESHGAMWVRMLNHKSDDLITSSFSPDHGFSVRCIKDQY